MVHAQSVVTGSRTAVLQVAVFLIAVLLVAGCNREEKAVRKEVIRPVKTFTVRSAASSLSLSFPGTVRAARRAVLSFKVSGPLVRLPVEEGQHVKKGDLIAQIQKRDFLTALEEAKVRALEAERQFRRYGELYARRQVSRADYDRYRAARDVARARLEDARNRLRDTSLLAPFDGIISRRYVENFQKVQAKEPIVNLHDITRIEILVNVPEQVMAEIRNRKDKHTIVATFDAIPGKEFPLQIKEYSTQADPATQTYQVVLVMDQPREANILPGMTALVTARTTREAGTGDRSIIIPAIAVLDAAGDRPYVWVLDPKTGTVHRRFVTVGRIVGSRDIVIRKGFKGGETIVVAGQTQLEEGMKVRPWEKQREFK